MHLVPLFCLFIFCFLLIEWSEVPAFPHECNGISVPTTLSLLSSTQHNSVPARLSIWIDFIDHSVLDLARKTNWQCQSPILIHLPMAQITNSFFKPAATVSCLRHTCLIFFLFSFGGN